MESAADAHILAGEMRQGLGQALWVAARKILALKISMAEQSVQPARRSCTNCNWLNLNLVPFRFRDIGFFLVI